MAFVRKLFPFSLNACDLKSLIITILIYLVADCICGCVIGFLGRIPLIGLLFALIGWVLGIYFFVGIVIAVLNFLGALKG